MGLVYLQQSGHSDSEIVKPGGSFSWFMIVTEKKESSLWVYLGPHEFFYCSAVVEKTPARTLYMDEVVIAPLPVLVCYVYLQHEDPEWNGTHRLRYYVYFISIDVQLKNAVAFAYGDCLMSGAATTVDWKAAKLVKTYEQNRDYVEIEEVVDVPDMGDWLTSS